jgi:hypothetical protein
LIKLNIVRENIVVCIDRATAVQVGEIFDSS